MTKPHARKRVPPDARAAMPGAKRSLGQNFLRDANIARKIVTLLDAGPEDQVLEIGPGQGALTGLLRTCGARRLVLVEKDRALAFARKAEGVAEVILGDALAMPWERFSEPWKCIGNLPYNVASPLMWEIVSRARGLQRAVFMVQKEVALRLTARAGTSAYGALSVWVQSFVRPALAFTVPPQVFWPRPKVDSAVVVFSPFAFAHDGKEPDCEPADLAATLKTCFQRRRKQLGSIARACGVESEALERLGIDPGLRPENLTPENFQRLAGAGFFCGRAGR